MPVHPSVKVCTHIKVTGVRCGSPALRGEQFCYFHQRMIRGVQIPTNSRLHPVALIEDEEAIQSSLMEVINALARNTIDLRRAELILKALYIAVKNSRRARFENHSGMVRQVPDYSAAAEGEVCKDAEGAPPLSRTLRQGGNVDPGSPMLPAPRQNSIDPTRRKPAARAGLPAERAKPAAAGGTRKNGVAES